MNEKTLGNKYLYKLFIIISKYLPYVISITQMLGIVFNYFEISCVWLSFLGGCSLGVLVILFLISYVFRFCSIHRIPLYYTSFIYLMRLIDEIVGIPISALMLFRVHAIIAGITILLYGFYFYKNRNKPKVNHIKSFCERYCDC